MALSSEAKQVIKVKWVNDSRSWSNISTAKKSLFPSNWTDKDIADALKQAERDIVYTLHTKYNLPIKWERDKFWREYNLDDNNNPVNIIYDLNLNWKIIKLRLWWRYDYNWDIDYNIETLFPD